MFIRHTLIRHTLIRLALCCVYHDSHPKDQTCTWRYATTVRECRHDARLHALGNVDMIGWIAWCGVGV